MTKHRFKYVASQVAVFLIFSTTLLWSGANVAARAAQGDEATGKEAKSKKSTTSSEIEDIIKNLDYPELQVVPRASERLKLEAKEEESTWFLTHWPVMISGLSTAAVGAMTVSQQRDGISAKEKTDMANITLVAEGMGAGWFLAGLVLGFQRPYSAGLARISKYPGKDERSVLMRERLAEESLERPATIMRPLTVAAVLSNITLSIACGAYMNDQGKLMAGGSAILGLLPVLFEDPTIMIYDKHLEYKKKIYGPLTSTGLGFDKNSKTFYPTANFAWTF